MKYYISNSPIVDALRKKYSWPSWAFLEEVRDRTSFYATRSCDAVALGIWKSRGHGMQGFEIKASRSDWLRELADPAKAEAMAIYCERWWIVAGSDEVVRRDELPDGWGLMVLGPRGLKVTVQAAKRKAEPLPREIVINLLRRALEQAHQPRPQAEIDEEEARRREAEIEARVRVKMAEVQERLRKADAFDALALALDVEPATLMYEPYSVRRALALLAADGRVDAELRALRSKREHLAKLLDDIDGALAKTAEVMTR